MATLHTDSAEHSHEYRFVSLIKRTPDGIGDPHVFQLSEINTIEKLLHISQRLFDTDTPPRIFTENNCPIPYTCWVDTARGTGRSGQHFYLEIYEQQYTKATNRSSLALPAPVGNAKPPTGEIRPVIFVIYPEGLFSTYPLPDDLIVECIPLDIKLGTLADNIKEFLSREFSPNVTFTIRFENASNYPFNPGDTVKESGIENGALVYCRLGLLDFPS